jgi:3',5'-cyclic-AMP phosphodiesterase
MKHSRRHVLYSVTNIDGDVVSWRFVELGALPVVVIISPSDERLLTKSSGTLQGILTVRAKSWGKAEAVKAAVHLGGAGCLHEAHR